MSRLPNGTVLPHGLLGTDSSLGNGGFNKTYKNYALKMGVIVASYGINDDGNVSGLTTEYDVVVFEQNENRGTTDIKYRNCMSVDGLGSIADYFERNLRVQKNRKNNTNAQSLGGQDGATVLILCLDGVGNKGIIIGAVPHPDRPTNLQDTDPHLEGEYNGMHVVVNADGSAAMTFKGATDNSGKVLDSTQGNTEISIEKDGSYQVMHKSITQRLDKNGKMTTTTDDDVSFTTKTNFNVTTTKDVGITASGNMSATMTDLTLNASGSALLQGQKIQLKGQSEVDVEASQINIKAESMANIKAASIVLDGLVALGGQGGQPLLLLNAMMMGVGNLGAPVISQAISGFTVKVTAT